MYLEKSKFGKITHALKRVQCWYSGTKNWTRALILIAMKLFFKVLLGFYEEKNQLKINLHLSIRISLFYRSQFYLQYIKQTKKALLTETLKGP